MVMGRETSQPTRAAASPTLTHRQVERFRRLAMPHLASLLRAAGYLTRDDHDAEDLVQEVMIKVMHAIDSFADGTNITAWLMTILRRAHIDAVRSGRRRSAMVSIEQSQIDVADAGGAEAEPPQVLTGNPGESDRWIEQFGDREVIDALKTLPEDIRWTLLLVDVQQMDHAQASAVLEVPVGTIKSRAHRGRAMLRLKLTDWARERGWLTQKESRHA